MTDLAPLTEPERLAAYRDAAANWRYEGFIQFVMHRRAYEWLNVHLGQTSTDDLAQLIAEFVLAGGEIDEVKEGREIWRDRYEYHIDLRITIQGKLVYIETRLEFSPPFRPDESSILVVNIHDP